MKYRLYLCILLSIVTASLLPADSLVPSGFSGHLGSDGSLLAGALVRVTINSETRLSLSVSSQTDSRINIAFTGGDGDGLFTFLPTGESGNQSSADAAEESVLEARLAARVVEVAADGSFLLRGSREIQVDRGMQRIEVEGWGQMSMVDDEGRIPFDSLADSNLTYQTFLNSPADIIRSADLDEVMTPAPATGETGVEQGEALTPEPAGELAVEPAVPATEPPAGEDALAADPAAAQPEETFGGYALTREIRQELLLQYINQMINLLFTTTEE